MLTHPEPAEFRPAPATVSRAFHFPGDGDVTDLSRFADELAQIRDLTDAARFRDADRYVERMDALRRSLTDLVERMRSAASRAKAEPSPFRSLRKGPDRRTMTDRDGRRVVVERRRRTA